ncbi:MAG: hypothetical protein IKB54_00945, partial [Clostridia bacterium]|nr:hypothetical protein [Clostridia bacterium]
MTDRVANPTARGREVSVEASTTPLVISTGKVNTTLKMAGKSPQNGRRAKVSTTRPKSTIYPPTVSIESAEDVTASP